MQRVKVKIPATTTNLGPGFDCLGLALSLYNTVELSFSTGETRIEVEGEGTKELQDPNSNWVMKGVDFIYKKIGIATPKVNLKLENHIPFARGLGSSAAAFLGGLVTANLLSGKKFAEEEILEFAVDHENHPDNVVPAMVGGFVISCRNNGKTSWIKCHNIKIPPILLIIPEMPMGTKESRATLPENISFQDATYNIARSSMLVAALRDGRWDLLQQSMDDRLHQPYRDTKDKLFSKVIQAAYDSGALGAALSGSGSTIFTFVPYQNFQVKNDITKIFKQHSIPVRLERVEVDWHGLIFQDME